MEMGGSDTALIFGVSPGRDDGVVHPSPNMHCDTSLGARMLDNMHHRMDETMDDVMPMGSMSPDHPQYASQASGVSIPRPAEAGPSDEFGLQRGFVGGAHFGNRGMSIDGEL